MLRVRDAFAPRRLRVVPQQDQARNEAVYLDAAVENISMKDWLILLAEIYLGLCIVEKVLGWLADILEIATGENK